MSAADQPLGEEDGAVPCYGDTVGTVKSPVMQVGPGRSSIQDLVRPGRHPLAGRRGVDQGSRPGVAVQCEEVAAEVGEDQVVAVDGKTAGEPKKVVGDDLLDRPGVIEHDQP